MSAQQPTYEESLDKIAKLETKVAAMEEDHKDDMKSKKAQKEEEKETKDAFKIAQDEMKEKDKEHQANNDDREKVKDAFKKAQDEKDPEKKKEAMKKAIEEKEDYENKQSKKGSKKAESEKPFQDKEKDAKIANLEKKYKDPLVAEILNATKILDPTNYDLRLKELTAATLEEVEKDHAKLKPFMAGLGLAEKTPSAQMPTMIPFQASQATGNPDDIFSASIDEIDFSKIPTEKILEMYQ